MKRACSLSLLFGWFAISVSVAEQQEGRSQFSLTFLPGISEEWGLRPSQGLGEEGWRQVGGVNLGFHAPEGSGKWAWHSNVNVNEFQTLVTGGLSSLLFETDSLLVSSQALGGYAFGRDGFDDSFHGSFDLYGATALGYSGANYLKLGMFADVEERFGKWGPELALLLGANREHPVTLDFAYGHGMGKPYQRANEIWTVAEDDLQIRAGVFLSPRLQVGVSGHYQKWDDVAGVEEDWKTGGFINWYRDDGWSLGVGVASGEHGSNGFANLSFQPVSQPFGISVVGKEPKAAPGFPVPRSWMAAPVRRLHTVGVRRISTNQSPLGGTLTGTFFVFGDPVQALGSPADELRVTYTNTTGFAQAVTIVSIEQWNQVLFNPGVSATVNPGSNLSAATPPNNSVGFGPPWVQTVVLIVNGRTFTVDLTFPGGVINGHTTPPVRVGP